MNKLVEMFDPQHIIFSKFVQKSTNVIRKAYIVYILHSLKHACPRLTKSIVQSVILLTVVWRKMLRMLLGTGKMLR